MEALIYRHDISSNSKYSSLMQEEGGQGLANIRATTQDETTEINEKVPDGDLMRGQTPGCHVPAII